MDDFAEQARFWRIPEGNCELLAARYSNQTFGRHCHERYAFGAITDGVEKLYYRGAHHLGTAGSLVTISPGEIHDGRPADDGGWRYRMLYVDTAWLNDQVLQDRVPGDHVHLFQQAFTSDRPLARYFLHVHQRIETSADSLERESLLLELLATLFQRQRVLGDSQVARERHAVRQIRQTLEREFERNISLEELGRLVGMDALYLIRVFKKEVGVAPHSYLIQQRIAQVQRLLRSGMGLADAALACGFCDQSHMTKAFKKVVGVTPRSFRAGLPTSID